MRNNGKTSVIDCGGYGSTFDMILFPRVWFLASHNRHGVYLGRRTSEKRWRQREIKSELEIGLWEEYGRIKIRVRDKI
jgi:hypothetical protein